LLRIGSKHAPRKGHDQQSESKHLHDKTSFQSYMQTDEAQQRRVDLKRPRESWSFAPSIGFALSHTVYAVGFILEPLRGNESLLSFHLSSKS
jgi:hypothetical protein